MDSNSVVTIVIISLFALISVILFLRYRNRSGVKIKAPLGFELDVQGDNEEQPSKPGIVAKGITSRQGGVLAEENLGQGINAENIDAMQDVVLRNQSSSRDIDKPSSALPQSELKAQALYAGGNISIQQFVGGQMSQGEQLEFFAKQIGLPNPRNRHFKNSEFKAYCDAWKNLQALRLAGDDLWEEANNENILNFAQQLRKTKEIVMKGDIFFEDKDRDDLLEVLRVFAHFQVGKEDLIQIRSKEDIEEWGSWGRNKVREQINRNYECKCKYEDLLENIRASFRQKISGH